jgi:hypothetical protein
MKRCGMQHKRRAQAWNKAVPGLRGIRFPAASTSGFGVNKWRPQPINLRIELRFMVDRNRLAAYRFGKGSWNGKFGYFGGIAVNMKRFIVLVLLAGLFAVSRPIFAHHSAAEYDSTKVTSVKGTVTLFEWSNPHAYIYIDVKDDKGDVEKWTAELGSLGMLSRANWKRDTVKPGDQVTAYGNRAKDGRTLLRLDKIVFASGQEISARVL